MMPFNIDHLGNIWSELFRMLLELFVTKSKVGDDKQEVADGMSYKGCLKQKIS